MLKKEEKSQIAGTEKGSKGNDKEYKWR